MAEESEHYSTHLFEYNYEDATWVMEVTASSPEDAQARLTRCANWGTYLGGNAIKVPGWVPSWLLTLWCWLTNKEST